MRHRRTVDLSVPQKPAEQHAELLDSIPKQSRRTPDLTRMTDTELVRYGQHLRSEIDKGKESLRGPWREARAEWIRRHPK